MPGIYLLAETPRTDEWDHRYIISPNTSLSQSRIRDIISQAREISEGKDYLAIVREVIQPRSGREGQEILALCGIDVKRLSSEQKEGVLSSLQRNSHQLEYLVTNVIQWAEAENIIVERQEFFDWQNAFQNLPLYVDNKEQSIPRTVLSEQHSKSKKRYAAIAFIAMVMVISLVISFRFFSTAQIKGNILPQEDGSAFQIERIPAAYPHQSQSSKTDYHPDTELAEKFIQCLENGGLTLSKNEKNYSIQKINNIINEKENYKIKSKIESLFNNNELVVIEKSQNMLSQGLGAVSESMTKDADLNPEIVKSCEPKNMPIGFFIENSILLRRLLPPENISGNSYDERLKKLSKLRGFLQFFSDYTQEAEALKKYCGNAISMGASYLYFITCSVTEIKYKRDEQLKLPFLFQQDFDAILKVRKYLLTNSYQPGAATFSQPSMSIPEALKKLAAMRENLMNDIDYEIRNKIKQDIEFNNLKEKFKLLLDYQI